jgi:hypothetical protein
MEGIVDQPACASVAAPPHQLNDPPPSWEPHRQRQPSGSHATDRSSHAAGLSHLAYAAARTEHADKVKGNRKGYGARTGNEERHRTVAPSSHLRPPPRPGSHLKPRRSWELPAVSHPRAATTLQHAAPVSSFRATAAPLLLVQGLPPPLPSNSFIPRSNSRSIAGQEAFKFNTYPYLLPFPVLPPPITTPSNYFHGFTPFAGDTNSIRFYHLASTVMSSSPTASGSPTQTNPDSWQERLKGGLPT